LATSPNPPENLGRRTFGCPYELHGMFLSPYADIKICGVAKPDARVAAILRNHYSNSVRTNALRIEFCDDDYWIFRKNGAITIREREPGKLLKTTIVR
jgi:hypothetical protein